MAALLEGQQYGLSAQDKINCNKSLVFVKLTDSALRSIEEYVKNKGNISLPRPTIEFQNNNGVIRLPQNGNSQTYGFTVSNVEADGPQGSFECLRQTGNRSLESLGCMHMKMHIHANEDSYEKTRVKMAAAEQEHKKFCTKEIKPNGPHLGRKVKVKRPGLVVSPVKLSSPPSSSLLPKNPVKVSNHVSLGSSNIPTVKKPEQQKFPRVPSKNKYANTPELLRQPIRDRIIHILAVRPYKRPELLVKLMNEGIREKDRKGITAVLSQVGTLKGNVYSLAKYLWNEVQENWKYCTDEEAEKIRKRKQQLLGANNENEVPSPNNQPNSSPVQKRSANQILESNQDHRSKKQRISHYNRPPDNASNSVKSEPIEYSASDKIQLPPATMNYVKSEHSDYSASEKNHFPITASYRKTSYSPGSVQSFPSRNGQDDTSQKSPMSISYDSYPSLSQKNSVSNGIDDVLLSSNNQRNCTREDNEKNIRNHTSRLSQGVIPPTNHEKSFQKGQPTAKNNRFEMDESSRRCPTNLYQKNFVNSDTDRSQNQILSQPQSLDSLCDPKPHVSPDSNSQYQGKESKIDTSPKTVSNGYVNNSIKTNYGNQPSYVKRSKVTSTTNGSCSNSPHSSSDSRDSMDYNSSGLQVPPPTESPPQFDCPDYVKEYGTIESGEQRARYKADFNAQYEEYLRLHSKIKGISRKFAALEHHLHTCEEGSEEFKRIKSKIYKEYRAHQQDPNYLDALKKFNFLHCKLSHIKRLVTEYDKSQCVKS